MNATPARSADLGGPVALIEDRRALPEMLTLEFRTRLWVFVEQAKLPSPPLPRSRAPRLVRKPREIPRNMDCRQDRASQVPKYVAIDVLEDRAS